MRRLQVVPLKDIRENQAALRVVHRDTPEFLEMVESVRAQGILNPINVREVTDPETGVKYFSLIDGLHRYWCAVEAGLDSIPCHILDATEIETLQMQVTANLHRIDTKPVEYSQALQRLMAFNPLMSIHDLAKMVNKSSTWVSERLNLTKLDKSIGVLVDEGKINLTNAFALARMPVEEQPAFVERAMTMQPAEFANVCAERRKQIQQARREGRVAGPEVFQAQPFLRKISEVKDELAKAVAGPAILETLKVTSPVEAWSLAVAWVLNMDPESQEAQKRRDDERRQKAEEAKEQAATERKKKNQDKARLNALRLQVEIDARQAGDNIEEALARFDAEHNLKVTTKTTLSFAD